MGANIGARAYIDTLYLLEWDLIELGDDCCINTNTVVQCHTAEGMMFKYGEVNCAQT